MSTILTCYSRVDRDVAARVIRSLRDLGVDAFWDQDMPGVEWAVELGRQFDQLAAFLVIWSPAAAKSGWVRHEASIALDADKLISAGWGADAPFPFDRLPTARLDGWTGILPHPGWTQLVAAVDAHMARRGGRPGEVAARLAARDAAVGAKQRDALDAKNALDRARREAAEGIEQARLHAARADAARRQAEQIRALRVSPAIMSAADAELTAAERAQQQAQAGAAAAADAVAAAERRFEATTQALATLVGARSTEGAVELLTPQSGQPAAPSPAGSEASTDPAVWLQPDARAPRIAISYRRADSRQVTERIVDRLLARYGDGAVFIDIDSIPVGERFRDYIERALAATDVLLVMIGKRWVGRRRNAPSRIMESGDLVRIEVETALRYGLPLIPVLIDGGRMPSTAVLPPSIHELRGYNATEVETGRDFNTHIWRLIKAIDDLLARRPPEPAELRGATVPSPPASPPERR